jgi:hypothetical protein
MIDAATTAAPPADQVIGRIETDRYCDECGFNMRTLPVVRDGRTGLLVARCTECGRLAHAATGSTAGRVWLQRLAVLALALWMAAILGATMFLGFIETIMHALTLDELTEWSPAGRMLNEDVPHYWLFVSVVLSVSAGAAFIMVSIYACAAHHWKRVLHVAFAVLIPMIPMTIAWRAWRYEAPHLELWAWLYLLAHAGVQVSAGVLGALFGRRAARGLATILLPPRTRTILGFLWLADGKPIPSPRGGQRDGSISGIS